MDPYDIGIYGGGTLGTLGGIGAYQTLSDMNAINKMAAMGNYSSLNPMPQEFMNKLKGAWTPSSTFQKTGYPTGLKNWFFSRSSPQHFGPVERMMNWGRAGLPYLKQGAKFLRRSPLYGAASDVLFGTDITASSVKDINKLLGVSTEKEEAAKKAAEEEAARRAAAAAKAAALAGGAAGASTSSGGGWQPDYSGAVASQQSQAAEAGQTHEQFMSDLDAVMAKGGLVGINHLTRRL